MGDDDLDLLHAGNYHGTTAEVIGMITSGWAMQRHGSSGPTLESLSVRQCHPVAANPTARKVIAATALTADATSVRCSRAGLVALSHTMTAMPPATMRIKPMLDRPKNPSHPRRRRRQPLALQPDGRRFRWR
jgi:hypothetical protein